MPHDENGNGNEAGGVITVQRLTHYPVKGCAGTDVRSARVGETGLEHDRTFMVVDPADGTFHSQRTLPALAAVRPEVLDGGAGLRLSADGAEPLLLEIVPEGPRRRVSLFGKPVGEAVDQGDEVAEWFSGVLGAAARLVRVPPGFDRDGWGATPGKVAFADAHALLIASQSSLDGLNARIGANGGRPVPMDRFRANVVLDGCAEPHDEDLMDLMEIGTAAFAHATPAARCAVPMVDQRTGLRDGPEPIRTLSQYRREPSLHNKITFGLKAAVVRHGTLSVGDPVTTTWRAEPYRPPERRTT
ncbi:MOSC domain-containing protein [Streptomyces clavuligerus]|uniref:MOSC domain protein beta barrel domain protein n=1 Tax=Streptomyces clavuligerus TaxID=1901 RepID=E2Q0W2_STRCL|nr:MOSC N-terminal beta barrel domain-containing protein [Streptomyces clavuligerus]ANW20511.1 molybdenum cofactor sulfurase [Streptomyces clavuligerus]AXU15137.1 MOSC domain-containing protein [Streptomyces clavuligerus]EFG06505.1 MOSC domain protein beta barrel domain protein [Streptomyces clavuligerus]MBY6305202.1 MOSC domain-containing protein [Streptomyces clavuligerus]QCS07912.1 MOSC domain-containing protein [Streptomyces clavuligerus]